VSIVRQDAPASHSLQENDYNEIASLHLNLKRYHFECETKERIEQSDVPVRERKTTVSQGSHRFFVFQIIQWLKPSLSLSLRSDGMSHCKVSHEPSARLPIAAPLDKSDNFLPRPSSNLIIHIRIEAKKTYFSRIVDAEAECLSDKQRDVQTRKFEHDTTREREREK
jgi:hypothetical protein